MKKLRMFILAFLLVLSGMTFNVNLDSFVNNEKPLEFKTKVYASDVEGFGTITIVKEVEDNKGNDVDEFTIVIKDESGTQVAEVTLKDGGIDTIGLPYGEYTIQETHIPSNYEFLRISVEGEAEWLKYADTGKINLNSDFYDITATVVNRLKPTPPPSNREPRIKLEKTVYPTKAKVGDIVEYILIVKNTGDYTLRNVTITDPILEKLGELDEFKLDRLGTGDSKTVNVRYIIPLGASGQLENTATVTGRRLTKNEKVSDTDSAVLEIVENPAIGMVKSVNKTLVEPGETVDYSFIVTNIGEEDLQKVVVTDLLFGEEWKHEIGNLKVGEKSTFTQSYTVTEDASGNIENIAIVTGSHGDKNVMAIGKANIDIQVPPEPEKPEEPEEPLPDLPHTGGPVQPEILYAGMGGLILLIGKMLRNKK